MDVPSVTLELPICKQEAAILDFRVLHNGYARSGSENLSLDLIYFKKVVLYTLSFYALICKVGASILDLTWLSW